MECAICINRLTRPADTTDLSPATTSTSTSSVNPGSSSSTPVNSTRTKGRPPAKSTNKSHCLTTTSLTDVSALACGHLFHSVCLKSWISKSTSSFCPTCRKPVTQSKILQIYVTAASDIDPDSQEITVPSRANTSNANANAVAIGDEDINDLRFLHTTLISDYEELLKKYEEEKAENDLNGAIIQSLQQQITILNGTISELKRSKSGSSSEPPRKLTKHT